MRSHTGAFTKDKYPLFTEVTRPPNNTSSHFTMHVLRTSLSYCQSSITMTTMLIQLTASRRHNLETGLVSVDVAVFTRTDLTRSRLETQRGYVPPATHFSA